MTDARLHNARPRLNLSAHEWKLFVIGGLGVAYAASLSVVPANLACSAHAGISDILLVTLHGMLAGSDSATPWMRLMYLFSSAIVLLLVSCRLVARSAVRPVAGGRVGVPGS